MMYPLQQLKEIRLPFFLFFFIWPLKNSWYKNHLSLIAIMSTGNLMARTVSVGRPREITRTDYGRINEQAQLVSRLRSRR